MPPASLNRRARASLVCAVVALFAVPGAASAVPTGDPDARLAARTTREIGPDTADSATVAAPRTDRLGGADRYATAAAVSRAAYPTPTTSGPSTVYLASGAQYADALSAGPVAVARDGALLLTGSSHLPTATETELRRLGPDRVVVVGSSGAVADTVVSEVGALGLPVSRISGSDRYATSEALAREGFPSGARTAWVATGNGYADALAAGVAASAAGGPVILVDGAAPTLASSTRELLQDLGVTSVRIAGGPSSVSTGIESGLDDLLGASEVQRAAGSDRYATAIAVNDLAFRAIAPGDSYVASGMGFADGLSVGVLAGRAKRPVYLSTPYCANGSVRSALSRPATTRIRLVGGPGAIRGLVGTLEPCLSTTAASSPWVVVNKKRPLAPLRYAPSPLRTPAVSNINGQQLRADAAAALAKLVAGSKSSGAGGLAMLSGYRSFGYQSGVYSAKVASSGSKEADRWVARPGYSEHQTGLGTDVSPVGAAGCSSYSCIGSTPQGRWIAANSWRYGFIVRYESGRTATTGYNPEPWHLRYVGLALARDYHAGGWHTLEDYFGLPAAPGY